MTIVYRYNSYPEWVAAEQQRRPERRRVANANVGLYSAWGGIALTRSGMYVEAITAFFRANAALSLFARLDLTGVRHAVSQVGLTLGCVASTTEMVIASLVFGRDAHRYRALGKHLDRHQANHDAFFDEIAEKKNAAHDAKHDGLRTSLLARRAATAPASAAVQSCDDAPGTCVPKDVKAVAKSYFEYEVGRIELPEATNTFKRSLWMFLRDGPLQGGAVSCNLATLWQAAKVSDLLHIATVPANAIGTAIGGAAFSVACGVLHIVAGVLARSEGLQKLAAATNAKAKIDSAIQRIDTATRQREAAVDEAAEVGAALLRHAAKNEDRAQDDARKQIRVGKWRIGYGTMAIAIAALSLTCFVIAGGLSMGGIVIAFVGGLVVAGWVGYAAYRNRQDARRLQAAVAEGKGAGPAMPLEEAIARAVVYLDRNTGIGKEDRAGRRMIKHALMDIGMKREDFWALRFCADDPEVKDSVVDTLKVLIHNLVDGDGARTALAARVNSKRPASQ